MHSRELLTSEAAICYNDIIIASEGSVGLVYRAFGFYFEVKQRLAGLVLGWVTA